MRKWTTLLLVSFLVMTISIGCSRATRDDDEGVTETLTVSGSASLVVDSVTQDPTPAISVNFTNNGDTIASNISLSIKAMNYGDDDPIETLNVSPNVSELGYDDETWAYTPFSVVTDHAEYDYLIIAFSWDEEKAKSVTFTARQVISAAEID
jgi:hypothetical protein